MKVVPRPPPVVKEPIDVFVEDSIEVTDAKESEPTTSNRRTSGRNRVDIAYQQGEEKRGTGVEAHVTEAPPTVGGGQAADARPDPAANLPFNLRLTEKQKAAKAATVLPYMHRGNRNTKTTVSSATTPSGDALNFSSLQDMINAVTNSGPANMSDSDSESDPDDDLDI